MDVTDHFFATPDGPRLHYLDYRPPEELGTPVLCLHGFTRNERDFEELAPRISSLGRRAIAPSQRGRGRSDPDPNPDRYNPAIYAADMIGLLASLGVERAVFVGTSMGGLITMLAAVQAPQLLAGAVLNDVGPEVNPVGLARILGYAGVPKTAATWAEAAALSRAVNGAAFPDEQGEAFWEAVARRTFRERAPGEIVLDYDPLIARPAPPPDAGPPPDLWPLFEALAAVPALVIRGELSDILMASTVEEMRRRRPDLVVASIPRVGHAPFMTEPSAWAALRGFLEGAGRG